MSLNCKHHACMRAYSVDLRRKVVEAVQRGMSKAQAAWAFGVGIDGELGIYAGQQELCVGHRERHR